MNRSSLLFLLVLSVLFNVFFIFGAMQWKSPQASSNDRVEMINRIVSEMNLDEQQRNAFELLRTEFEEESAILSERIHAIQGSIAEELRNEDPNLESLGLLVQEEMDLRNQRRRAGSIRFEEFIEFLEPEQRRVLGRRLDRRRPPHDRDKAHHRMLEEFDHNGNGKLDPEERKEAEAAFEQRRRDRKNRRDELHKQFDLDGDGQLSPDEEQALREWMQQQNDRPGGPRGGRPKGPKGPFGPRPEPERDHPPGSPPDSP